MIELNRRRFLATSAASLAALSLRAASSDKPRVALVSSTHPKLQHPASPEDPLDYEKVRDMVWKAIEYGRPNAGSLEAKIKPGSWVVIKPNTVFLRPQPDYRSGDITDMRVTKAVLEYVAQKSRAARITIAEGGTHRNVTDPAEDNVVRQNNMRVNAATFDWGPDEFPGFNGSVNDMLKEFATEFPQKSFDYVDLSYDVLRDASGNFKRVEVPRTARGVGGFGERTDYFVTNTIQKCDFLVSVPVMKVHEQCGITACFKNYVGTAPRIAYAPEGAFHNASLHNDHSLEGRIDSFIADLAAFHPPDFSVVDGIQGLQYTEHNNNRPDQIVRNNLILAGENAVAADTLVAHLLGFNPMDIDFLHMAAKRELGVLGLENLDLIGDDADTYRKTWGKPRTWVGRCNRDWLLSLDPSSNLASWDKQQIPTDNIHFAKWAGRNAAPGKTYAAAVRVKADGSRKAYLWMGVHGRVTAMLNGETVTEVQNLTRYRVGQFRTPVELRSGENLLVFHLEAKTDDPRLGMSLVGPRNDGDTVEGIRFST